MAQTSSSSIWGSLGVGLAEAGLSYAQGKGIDVPTNSGNMTQPDVAAGYYGYGQAVQAQPTVGASTGSSTGSLLLIGGLAVAAVLVIMLMRRK